MSGNSASQITRLLGIMAQLRGPGGCPWDKVQTFASIAPYTVEEGFEVADAIARQDWTGLQDELGDLLFQVVYHARLAEEAHQFDFASVVESISNKMIRRHPHVFGEATARGVEDQNKAWEDQKVQERAERAETRTLAGVATTLPALTRAVKLTRRAARVGFDWAEAGQVLDKLEEEAAELRAELPAADRARVADELGDLFFVLANLARKLDLDPETCLRGTNAKFERRFEAVEDGLAAEGRTPSDASLERMEQLWQAAKAAERR